MKFVTVEFSDAECLIILRLPSLRKFRYYSLFACVQNEVSVGKVLWTGNLRVRWVPCHIVIAKFLFRGHSRAYDITLDKR
jgi:hypothetical protein